MLEHISQQLELKMTFDGQSLVARETELERRVSVSVEDANLDQLLEALFAPIGWTYQRAGDRVRIRSVP